MKRIPPIDPARIEQDAADWIARCDRGLTPAEAEAFARWENADPRHPGEFARLSAAWESLNTADEIPEVMSMVHALEERPKALRRFRSLFLPLAAAAVIAVVLSVGPIYRNRTSGKPDAVSYQVLPSSAHRLSLADGTVVELNGDSAVEPAFVPERRLVRLVRGEARFSVAPERNRPFVVQVGDVAVEAVGTAFNIRTDPQSIEVLVTEGRVRVVDVASGASLLARAVSPISGKSRSGEAAAPLPVLSAGERIVVSRTAGSAVAPAALSPSELDRATSWQSTQLVFDRTPLSEAVAVFNSFNHRQLVLGDPALGARRLGGTFRADNVDAFVRLLESGFDIKAEPQGDRRTVLRGAPQENAREKN